MGDYMDRLAFSAQRTIENGYYDNLRGPHKPPISLRNAILDLSHGTAVISEMKFSSPSQGRISKNKDVVAIARDMYNGGAVGLSILTEPHYFNGQLHYIASVRRHLDVPILMKDFILSKVQIEAARKIGASAVLLIKTLFDRGYTSTDIATMIAFAHRLGLEVLLEVHTKKEFSSVLATEADMIGINNRDLTSLKVDINTTKKILSDAHLNGFVVISESGITCTNDIRQLRKYGVHAFLIGTSIMRNSDIKKRVREYVNTT
ncbi:MAG: indole-3-glycerol-phosphate synthase [Candidatus Ranarchaeia archaeon]